MHRIAEIFVDIDLIPSKAVFVFPKIVLDRRQVDAWQVAIKEVPVHKNTHSLFKLGIVFVNDSGLFKVLLFGLIHLAVVFGRCELFDDRFKVFLVHGAPV